MVSVISRLLHILGCTVLVQGQGEGFADLPCNSGKNSKTWQGVKKDFRALFATGAVFAGIKRERLVSTLDKTMQDLKAAEALSPQTQSECGVGKLSLQMLSVNTVTDPMSLAQLITGVESLGSPILTMLLDVPFVAMAESGWPLFGFLSQLNWSRRQTDLANSPEADGLQNEFGRAFYVELGQALLSGNTKEMGELSRLYLNTQNEGNALGELTALAAQAALQSDPGTRIRILEALQTAFKQTIGSAAELDYALGTQWPLWGLLHEAVDGLAAPMLANA
jgi:hypothetical protein